MDTFSIEKINKLLKLEKPNDVLTMKSINEICQKLDVDLLSERLKITKRPEMLAKLYQMLGVKMAVSTLDNNEVMSKGYELLKVIYYSDKIKSNTERITLLVHLSASGILSKKFAEVRMILNEETIEQLIDIHNQNTVDEIKNFMLIIFLLLVRKLGGWKDVELTYALAGAINEKMDDVVDVSEEEAYSLEAYLNTLEALEAYRTYLISGKPDNIEKVIQRNIGHAKKILDEYGNYEMKFICTLIQETLIQQVQTSLWSTVHGVSETIDEYVEFLTKEINKKPIFDLWPSQKKAIATNLFDNSKSAVIVQMPTSAGKSLLAKFYILQVRNSYPQGKIAYIVPTRALVNQVKRDLKKEFSRFGICIQEAIPFMELDDVEEEVLIKGADLLITTPEKLDLMLRAKHPFVEQLKLVVVDEAHGIQEKNRGAKLELLLAMLRKQDRTLKILMLSPFMKNAKDIASWLSGDRGLDILVEWKPSQQFTAIDKIYKGTRGNHKEVVTYIPSVLNDMYYKQFDVMLASISRLNVGKLDRAFNLSNKYEKLGGVLILCLQRKYAEDLIKRFMGRNDLEEEKILRLQKLLELVEEEMGADSLLYRGIRKGCAYHHSSIPLIIREEIEEAIANELITIVAATTTLAQGMNFPIATVIFQGMSIATGEIPPSREMTSAEFWNIAGRAGRALVDKEGHILVICNDNNDEEKFRWYLNNKNQQVLSSLLSVVRELPVECLSLKYIDKHKELSSFLQYVYHTLKINSDIEIEDLLRGSYVYSNLEKLGEVEVAEKLLNITQNYIAKISSDLGKKNLMDIIDKTGLSSFSMHKLMAQVGKDKSFKMNVNTVFLSEDKTLAKVIDLANSIPEINLSVYESESVFNAELVTSITKAWVRGESIKSISQNNFNDDRKSLDEKMRICGKYIYGKLINNLPWALSAILKAQGIVDTKKEIIDDETILIPSYIYFGVNRKINVILCMLGVTRYASFLLGREWNITRGDNNEIEQIKVWLERLTLEDWERIFVKYKGRNAQTNYEIWKKNQ